MFSSSRVVMMLFIAIDCDTSRKSYTTLYIGVDKLVWGKSPSTKFYVYMLRINVNSVTHT